MTSRAVLWATVGDRSVASARVRAFELSEELGRRGWSSRVVPGSGLRGRIEVVLALLGPSKKPVVVMQKLFYGRLMLGFVRRRAHTLILECDDAVHLGYPGASAAEIETARSNLQRALAVVDMVTTSTPVLAVDLAPRHGPVVTFAGPSPPLRESVGPRMERIAIWLGSPSTAKYLDLLGDLPSRLREAGWECVAIGAPRDVARWGWTPVEWSPTTADHWLSKAAVGLMPQTSSEWDDRKAAYKVLEYAAAGVVPVASDVRPSRLLFDGHDLAGLLVSDNASWRATVESAWERREAWAPKVRNMARANSLETVVDRWESAVTKTIEQR